MVKKSIAIFTNTLLSGGAEKQAVLLAENMKHKYHVLLIIYYGDKVESKYDHLFSCHDLNVVALEGNHLKKMWALYHLLKTNQVSIIFSYLLTTNLIGAVIGKLAGVTVRAGGIRNAVLDKKKVPVQRFIDNFLSTHTIYNNYSGLMNLEKIGFDPHKATVIANCFELTMAPLKRPAKQVVNIVTVGRFVHQKGYYEALKVMQCLKNDGLQFKYIIVGFGVLEDEIRKNIIGMNLSDVVEMVINPADINYYYKRADIYLCSSHFEGLSNTVMEALSFTLPVVATQVGDNDRLVIDGVNGFLIESFNPANFIEPLKRLIASAELRDRMGREGYRLLKENYDARAFVAKYERFIKQVVTSEMI